jgi:hypothetical protein
MEKDDSMKRTYFCTESKEEAMVDRLTSEIIY